MTGSESNHTLDGHAMLIELVARGLSNVQIARELNVSLTTVQRRIREAAASLGTTSRVSLVVCAIEAGIVSSDGLCSSTKVGAKTPEGIAT